MKKHGFAAQALMGAALVALGGGCEVGGNGQWQVTWTISINGHAANCADVGAAKFSLIATRVGRTGGDEFRYNCSVGSAITSPPLAEGSYTVSVSLLDANNSAIITLPAESTSLLGSAVTNLGNFDFPFQSFSAQFSVHMGSRAVTGGNCTETAVNGAGVSQQVVTLTSSGSSQCLQATISNITDENNHLTTDLTCRPNLCQEVQQLQVINDLSDGDFAVQIDGLKGAVSGSQTVCYSSNDTTFRINGQSVDLGEILAPQSTSSGVCQATKE